MCFILKDHRTNCITARQKTEESLQLIFLLQHAVVNIVMALNKVHCFFD